MACRVYRLAFSACVFAIACAAGDPLQDGMPGGECANGQCSPGLVCVANMCVQPADETGGPSPTPPPLTTGVGTGMQEETGLDQTADESGDATGGTDDTGECPFTNDGVCDEPEGTGMCPEGTDVADCMVDDACTGDPAPAPAVCNQWTQNCPAGEKCNPYANDGGQTWNALGCFPLECDAAAIDRPCEVQGSGVSGIDDCPAGAMCWNVGNDNIGYCLPMCSGTPQNPSCAAGTCVITNGGVLSLCLNECDPVMQDCELGEGCYPVNEDFACAPDASGGPGQYGDSCTSINTCDPGLGCVGPAEVPDCADAGCCTPFCDLDDADADSDCASLDANLACVPWYGVGMAPAGYEHVGVCTIP